MCRSLRGWENRAQAGVPVLQGRASTILRFAAIGLSGVGKYFGVNSATTLSETMPPIETPRDGATTRNRLIRRSLDLMARIASIVFICSRPTTGAGVSAWRLTPTPLWDSSSKATCVARERALAGFDCHTVYQLCELEASDG